MAGKKRAQGEEGKTSKSKRSKLPEESKDREPSKEFEPDYDEESVESMIDDESIFSDSSQESHKGKVVTHSNVAMQLTTLESTTDSKIIEKMLNEFHHLKAMELQKGDRFERKQLATLSWMIRHRIMSRISLSINTMITIKMSKKSPN